MEPIRTSRKDRAQHILHAALAPHKDIADGAGDREVLAAVSGERKPKLKRKTKKRQIFSVNRIGWFSRYVEFIVSLRVLVCVCVILFVLRCNSIGRNPNSN